MAPSIRTASFSEHEAQANPRSEAMVQLSEHLVGLRAHLGSRDEAAVRRLDELAIALRAAEALAARAAGQEALSLVVGIKLRELARDLACLTLDVLGYYALPVYDPLTMGNEGPLGGELARDAVADLFRYVGGLDDVADRDRLSALTVASTAT